MRRRLDHVISLNQSRLDNVITQWTKINQIYIIGIYAAIEKKESKEKLSDRSKIYVSNKY